VYLGAFSAGWPHGPGRLIGSDGTVTAGVWKDGALQGAVRP
jgi:MORN repeat